MRRKGRFCRGNGEVRPRARNVQRKAVVAPALRDSQGALLVGILSRRRLTMARPEAYIDPLDAPPPWRDDASAKPLTVYTVNHPASPVAMSDVRVSAAPKLPETGSTGSGMFDK